VQKTQKRLISASKNAMSNNKSVIKFEKSVEGRRLQGASTKKERKQTKIVVCLQRFLETCE
jgi:hypothetical protein